MSSFVIFIEAAVLPSFNVPSSTSPSSASTLFVVVDVSVGFGAPLTLCKGVNQWPSINQHSGGIDSRFLSLRVRHNCWLDGLCDPLRLRRHRFGRARRSATLAAQRLSESRYQRTIQFLKSAAGRKPHSRYKRPPVPPTRSSVFGIDFARTTPQS